MQPEEILEQARSEQRPSSWTVFVAQKGKASVKLVYYYGLTAVFAVLSLIWLGSLFWWRPSSGVVALAFPLVAAALFGWLAYTTYRFARKHQRDATDGIVVLTDDAVVYPDGPATHSIPFSTMANVLLKVTRIQGWPRLEVIVETTSGERIIIIEGTQYGEPQQIVNTIRAKARIEDQDAIQQSTVRF